MATNPNKPDTSAESLYTAFGRLEQNCAKDRDHIQQPHMQAIAVTLVDLKHRLGEAAKVTNGEAADAVRRLQAAILT